MFSNTPVVLGLGLGLRRLRRLEHAPRVVNLPLLRFALLLKRAQAVGRLLALFLQEAGA